MALDVEKGVFTLVSGSQTINLADSGITPKALILWAAYNTAEGAVDGDGIFSFGMGTRDGGATQQQFTAIFDDDAVTSSTTVRSFDSDAILCGLTVDSGTEATATDYIVTLTSFGSGAFTLNCTNAPASAIKVHYMVLGGDDITAARVGEFAATTAVATQDVTINAGFGQPDLLIVAGCGTVTRFHQTDARFYLGFGKSNTERMCTGLHIEDASATMSLSTQVLTNRILYFNGTGTGVDAEASLSAVGSWPTDGFELDWQNQASIAALHMYLALKGDFTATIGNAEMQTAGGNQDLALASGNPVGALFATTMIPLTPATPDTTHADLGGIGVGGTDGTHEGFAGIAQDDGNADSRASRYHSESRALVRLIADAAGGAATIDAEADSSFSGTNVRLNWGNAPALAADYIYLLLGEAGGTAHSLATTIAGTGTVAPSVKVQHPVATLIEGIGAVAPALKANRGLATLIEGVATVTPALTSSSGTAHTLATLIAGVGEVSSAVKINRGLSAIIDGTGAVSPAVKINRGLSVTVDAVGSLSPALKANRGLATVIDGQAAVSPTLRGDFALAAIINAEATVVPVLSEVDGGPAEPAFVSWVNTHRLGSKRGR